MRRFSQGLLGLHQPRSPPTNMVCACLRSTAGRGEQRKGDQMLHAGLLRDLPLPQHVLRLSFPLHSQPLPPTTCRAPWSHCCACYSPPPQSVAVAQLLQCHKGPRAARTPAQAARGPGKP